MNLIKNNKVSFDITDYIDSKDVREYHKQLQTVFYPIEMALIIWFSRKITVDEKLKMWKELLEVFSAEEFQRAQYAFNEKGKVFKDTLQYTVDVWEDVLKKRYDNTEDIIFETQFGETDYWEQVKRAYFHNYDDAYKFLKELKKEYLDDEDLCGVETRAKISIVPIGELYGQRDSVLFFDTNLQMVDIDPEEFAYGYEYGEKSLYSFYFSIPSPFKVGDILKTISPGKKYYGVLPYDIDKTEMSANKTLKDNSDMLLVLDICWKGSHSLEWGNAEFNPLEVELCTEEELPEVEKNLVFLQKVYQGELKAGNILRLFSDYGEKAYKTIYSRR